MLSIKKRRYLIIYWSVSLLIITVLLNISMFYLLKNNSDKLTYIWVNFLMNSGLDFAIFLSAYFVPFFFRTNRYPYVTCEENAFEIRFLNELSFHQWVWTLLFPILIAVLLPTIILIYTLTSFLNINSTYDKFYILNYFITITIFLINNLSFLWFIKHNGEKEARNINNDFVFKN